MNATHLNLYQVCRLCLSELNGSSFIPIFDNKDSNLPQKIKSCFAISVEETDRLPNVLCPACTRDVERFYKFKEKVLKNNAFLRSYVFQRDRKAAQFLSGRNETSCVAPPSPPMKTSKRATLISAKNKRNPPKNKTGTIQQQSNSLGSLNNYESCELSNTFFDNSNKVKVEIIPQVDNDMYSSSSGVYSDIKNVVEMWPSSSTEESSTAFRTIKSMEDTRAIASISENSSSKSPDYTSVIRHSSDDFRDGSSSYDKYISVHVKEEVCKSEGIPEEYDSEDTKSAVSLTFKEEDEDKLMIDEETMEVKQFVNACGGNQAVIGEDGRTTDSCILLRTLISTSNVNQLIQTNLPLKNTEANRQNVRKPATFSPQVLVNEMSSYSSPSQSSPRSGDNLNSEKSSTRRKQRCPTKSANEQGIDAGDETDEEVAEVANLMQHSQQHRIIYHQEIVNISPVTVTCSSNGREEIVGYNQAQFLDEVLSRHSSPATTPPMVVPSQAERLHKACDVLLRAASKIQDLPPGIQQEEVIVEEEEMLFANSAQLNDGQNEQITIRHNPVPLYEINFSSVNALNEANRSTKKIKSREKVQNMSTHKECSNCHAVQTTIWRRDRFGNIVCNACGLYYKLHNYDRPCRMRRDEIHKRNRKRNANENKAKKIKRNSGGNYELDSSKEQENSSGSYTPPTNFNEHTGHMSMSDLYQPLNVNSSGIKKNRWISASSTNSLSIKEEVVEEEEGNRHAFDEEEQIHEGIQPHMENVQEISINGSEDVETLNNRKYNDQEEDKLSVSAFQLSTHFVPINGKVYEDDYSNENSISETPLNLAAGN